MGDGCHARRSAHVESHRTRCRLNCFSVVQPNAHPNLLATRQECRGTFDVRKKEGRLPFGDAGGQALASADPPMHALHRSTVFPELVAKRMAELEPFIAGHRYGMCDTCAGQ